MKWKETETELPPTPGEYLVSYEDGLSQIIVISHFDGDEFIDNSDVLDDPMYWTEIIMPPLSRELKKRMGDRKKFEKDVKKHSEYPLSHNDSIKIIENMLK